MRIIKPHKSICKLYRYGRTQECLDFYRKTYEAHVNLWEKLKKEGVCDKTCAELVQISRATYYRHKRILKDLEKNILPPPKKPIKVNKPKWGETQKQLVLKIRRENPTYGKQKIAIILKRDHDQTISESTVGRILTFCHKKNLIVKSSSALRAKRKRNFKGHNPLDL